VATALGAKIKADEHLLQFTQIPLRGEEAEISVQTTTSEKEIAEKVCSKFKSNDVFCRHDYFLKPVPLL